ncbi:hypothetical protein GH975_03485 [Litorivicinus lipolyticus]|uniref:DUF4382 domain-containing protein n=1 Tax=Litorivicinus lipolyticus TaxID=418701 RepID=A0A5Q2Q672_9GAMM|nr:hypothetical protein [Litorivicinus lipolyticus]QGG79679.1 hypothetical protein GH975_03485 [Litorivicinus lipolyticus]
MQKYLTLSTLLLAMLVAGCNSDSLEINVNAAHIVSSLDGSPAGQADFEAEFSLLGELDDEQRAQLDAIVSAVESMMDIDSVEIESGDFGPSLLIEGSIPISNDPNERSPWYLKTSQFDDGLVQVELATGQNFEPLKSQMEDINFMLTPAAYHSVKYKLKGSRALVMAPAVEVDGVTHLFYRGALDKRLILNFNGGPFEQTGAGFVMSTE